MLLTGRVALVTGAARGIGRATALVLAEEGADVGVADVLPEVEATAEAIRKMGRRSAAAVFDIADPAAVREGVESIVKALGPIDVLVNNAGIVNNIAPVGRMSHGAWERELAVNLSGAFNMIREVVGSMVERRWGRIVNVSSIAALGGLHHQAGYAASKAGLIGLTKSVARELGSRNVLVNAVAPGFIETEMTQSLVPDVKDKILKTIPVGFFGKPADVAQTVLFLASEESSFITGQVITVDGGMVMI